MKLKVASANFYYQNKQPKKDALFLASLGVDVAGIQEGTGGNAQDIKEALDHRYDTFWRKDTDRDKQKAYLDVPVTFKKSLKVYKTWARMISKRSQKKDIGMPRAATVVRFEKEGYDVTFINTHCNAAVQNRTTKQPLSRKIRRVTEYVAGMIVLEQMVRNAKKRGDLVILVGDLNYREQQRGVWKFSPQAMFERTGLKYRDNGLDYIAFDAKFKISDFDVVTQNRTGSDHDWLTAVVETK
jgi:endonuclease/exonuclease/phosphatase family metal-dependent hydrolase